MGTKQTRIQIKKQKELEVFINCQKALAQAREDSRQNNLGHAKRKDVRILIRYIAAPIDHAKAIRPAGDFATKTYNVQRQVKSLVDHLFVRYPIPRFLYRAILSHTGQDLFFDILSDDEESRRESGKRRYQDWFWIAAQGGSLTKALSGILNKREVHWFLQAPDCNNIGRNLFWAKLAASGLTLDACQYLTEQLGSKKQQAQMGVRKDDLIRFYATEWSKMRKRDQQEITDYVRWMIREPTFSFKGRTYSSMLKLSQDWHNSIFSTTVREFRTWPQSFEPWIHEKKDVSIRAIELTNSRALADEGRRQRHCVYSYELDCIRGWSRIISLRWVVPTSPTEVINRLTVEINPGNRTITQIRGRCNRKADEHEMKMVRLWASIHNLKLDSWANE